MESLSCNKTCAQQQLNPKKIRSKYERKQLNVRLFEAVREGNENEVETLIRDGADVNTATDYGWTALMDTIFGRHGEIVKILIRTGADVNTVYNDGRTALIIAATHGYGEIIEMLIRVGADVNAATNNGWTALMSAAYWGHPEIVKMLIAARAKSEMRDNQGKTAHYYWKGEKAEFDRIIEDSNRRMVKAAR